LSGKIDRIRAEVLVGVETFELAWSGKDRLAHLADELCRTLVETDHRALRIGLFSIEIEHVLHAGDILGVDLRNAPHVLAPWFQVIFGQAPAHETPSFEEDFTRAGWWKTKAGLIAFQTEVLKYISWASVLSVISSAGPMTSADRN
jgi:hypothetical protein